MVDLANSHTGQCCNMRFDSWKRWFFCRAATLFLVRGRGLGLQYSSLFENDVLLQQLFPTMPPPLQVFLA